MVDDSGPSERSDDAAWALAYDVRTAAQDFSIRAAQAPVHDMDAVSHLQRSLRNAAADLLLAAGAVATRPISTVEPHLRAAGSA